VPQGLPLMTKTLAQTRRAFDKVHTHPAFKHSHNLAYCVYYGIALAEDHGAQFAIVAVLFCVAIVVAMSEGAGH
jgi:lipoprotein signal peptidase